jgi:hypothetical protein
MYIADDTRPPGHICWSGAGAHLLVGIPQAWEHWTPVSIRKAAGERMQEPMKGDRVVVEVDVGGGTKTYEIVAAKAGRRVEISNVRGAIEVSEVTRTGVVVRSSRFMSNRVVALIEYPAADDSDEVPRKAPSAQASML